MKAKKLLCLLLSLVLILTLAMPAAAADETTETEEEIPEYIVKMMEAAKAYNPDTTVLTVGGQEIPWNLYYYLLITELQTYIYYMGGLPTNFEDVITEDVTTEAYLKDSALSYSKYYATVYDKAAEYGVELTDEDRAEMEETWAMLTEQYGGEEALAELLEESCMSKELYMYLLGSNTMMTKLLAELYGENGEKLTEEEILAWANENNYVRVKHILYKYTGGDVAEDATEEEKTAAAEKDKEAVHKTAEKTLKKLEKLSGDKLVEEFEKLMTAESEDQGSAGYPDGYIFTSGTMVAEFEDAAYALEDNAISDIVETSYGCHIILRLPLEVEMVTQDQDSNTGANLTLRESAYNSMYNEKLIEWVGDAEAEWEPGFEDMSLNELFKIDPNAAPAADGEEAAAAEKSGMNKDTKTLVIVLAVIAVVVIALFVILRKKQDKAMEKADEILAVDAEVTEEAEEMAEEAAREAEETAEEAAEEVTEAAEEVAEVAEAAAEEKIEEIPTENTENVENTEE